MTEHDILFQADMVRAILRSDDPKIQTRRLITARNSLVDGAGMSQKRWDAMGFDFTRAWIDAGPSPAGNPGPYLKVPSMREGRETVHRICPRVQPGDLLRVRETHAPRADCLGAWQRSMTDGINHMGEGEICYYATTTPRDWVERWRPSIHMPRWASRITLEVTGVRPERLQELGVEDAEEEGCKAPEALVMQLGCRASPSLFRALWERINGPASWTANPFVWPYRFKRVHP